VTRHVRSCRMGELLRDRRLLCRRAHRIAIRCHDPDRHSADRARSVTGSRRVCNPNEIFEAVIALADYAGCHSPPKRSRASVDSAFGGTMGTFYTRFHLPLPSCEGDCAPLFGGVVRPSGSLLDHGQTFRNAVREGLPTNHEMASLQTGDAIHVRVSRQRCGR
jgi:hypothetical protein